MKSKHPQLQKMYLGFFVLSLSCVIAFFGINLGIQSTSRDAQWKENMYLFLYFTTWSNVFVTVLFGLKTFAKPHILTNVTFKIFEVTTLSSIMLTMLVFWTLLAPFSDTLGVAAYLVSDLLVHFLTCVVTFFTFFYELLGVKVRKKVTENTFKHSTKTLVYPVTWLAMAIIVYFALGYGKGDAAYFFLEIVQNPVWQTVVYFVCIIALYYGISLLLVWINNKYAQTS